MLLRGPGSAPTAPSSGRARAGPTPAGAREPRAEGEGRRGAGTISRAGCRTRTRAVRALTAAVREEAGRRRPTPRGREDGGDGAGGSGSRGGTPAGAHDAVGGMDAAIVGTQRRAERAAATQGRRDHQSCSPPQRPCPRSGIPGQSARGSRAGREADQCRAALQAVGGHSPKQPNSTGFPSFPTLLRARTGAARASELQTVPGYARVQRDLASLLSADTFASSPRRTFNAPRNPPSPSSRPRGRAFGMRTANARRGRHPLGSPSLSRACFLAREGDGDGGMGRGWGWGG